MTGICREALKTPATWRGPELQQSNDWVHRLTADEVAAILGGGRSTVYALAADGKLASVRIGRSVRFEESAVEDFIAKSRTKEPPELSVVDRAG